MVSRQYLSRDRQRDEEGARREAAASKSNLATVSVTLHPPRTNNVQLDTLLPAPTSGSPSNGARSLLFLPLCRHRLSSLSLPFGWMRERRGERPRPASPFALVAFSPFARHPSLPVRHGFVHGIRTYIPLILCFFFFFFDLRNSRSSRAGKHRPVRTHLGFAVFGCV